MERLNIADRTEPLAPKQPRIIIKDNKANFITNSTVRLIFPCSSDIGIVSKCILDKYLTKLKRIIKLNL